jgi:hypothetical protein
MQRHDIFATMKIERRPMFSLVPLLVGVLISTTIAHSQSGVTLRGIVTDQTGAAISGALVRLYSTKGLSEIKAASDAKFEFTNVDPGKYELEVTSPGFKKMTKDIEIGDKAPAFLSIVLQEGGGGHCTVMELGKGAFGAGADIFYVKQVDKVTVRGLVRDDLGSALAGVTVKLEGSGQFLTTVSNGGGGFEFSGVEPGKHILTASQAGFHVISRSLWIMQENLSKVTVTLPDIRRVPCFEDSGPGRGSE